MARQQGIYGSPVAVVSEPTTSPPWTRPSPNWDFLVSFSGAAEEAEEAEEEEKRTTSDSVPDANWFVEEVTEEKENLEALLPSLQLHPDKTIQVGATWGRHQLGLHSRVGSRRDLQRTTS